MLSFDYVVSVSMLQNGDLLIICLNTCSPTNKGLRYFVGFSFNTSHNHTTKINVLLYVGTVSKIKSRVFSNCLNTYSLYFTVQSRVLI